jgi:ribosome-binding factor A
MPKNEARLNRVNEELKKEISRVLTFELKNSKVTGLVSVTKAKITPDFKYAKVYVSILNSKSIGKTMEGLKESAGFIRSQVAKTINLRITPELIFEIDDSLEYGEKIEKILKELKNEGSGVNEE